MADSTAEAQSNVLLYFVVIMSFVGHGWNFYQIYQFLTRGCKKPEDNEQWDSSARLMLETVYNGALDHQMQHDAVIDVLEDVSDVVMREDEQGRKLVYFPKEFVKRLVEKLKMSIVTPTHSHSHSHSSSSD